MRTVYPIQTTQNAGWEVPVNTPENNAIRAERSAAMQAESKRMNDLIRNIEFTELLRKIWAQSMPEVSFDALILTAGAQHGAYPGPYDIADTPEKVAAYWLEANPIVEHETKATTDTLGKSMEREAKRKSRAEYAVQYEAYVQACQQRNQRHADAKTRHQQRVKESQDLLARETSDPAPVAPRKLL